MTIRTAVLLLLASGCVATVKGNGDDHDTTIDASLPDGTADAPASAFAAGDPFDYSLVDKRSQMVSTMLTELDYAASTAPRVVAVNADGLGYVSVQPGALTNDAARTALQACFVIGGGKPCVILAFDNTFQISSTALANPSSFVATLDKPTA